MGSRYDGAPTSLTVPTMRHVLIATILALSPIGAAIAADASGDPPPPTMVDVKTTEVFDAGTTKGNPNAAFAIVNAAETPCYAIAPPSGAGVLAGERYALAPNADVPDELRKSIVARYPKCTIVDAVARVMR
jgi:hypothetical protein